MPGMKEPLRGCAACMAHRDKVSGAHAVLLLLAMLTCDVVSIEEGVRWLCPQHRSLYDKGLNATRASVARNSAN